MTITKKLQGILKQKQQLKKAEQAPKPDIIGMAEYSV